MNKTSRVQRRKELSVEKKRLLGDVFEIGVEFKIGCYKGCIFGRRQQRIKASPNLCRNMEKPHHVVEVEVIV